MNRNFLIVVSCFLYVLLHNVSYSQNRLYNYPQLTIKTQLENATYISYSDDFPEFRLCTPIRPNDTPLDTTAVYRGYIKFLNNKYLIDSILLDDYSGYAGSYDLTYIFVVENGKSKWFVVSFYDGTQYGTFIQPCYLIFKKQENGCSLISQYLLTDIEDHSGKITNSVKVFFRKGRLLLKGKNLVMMKDFF